MAKSDELTAHFSWDEVKCRCCGTIGGPAVEANAKRLAFMLEQARAIYGHPMPVSSWYRCPAHNAAVGGVPNSYHLEGLAADIRVPSSERRFLLVRAAIQAGFTRIGVYENFVHLDLGPGPAPAMWPGVAKTQHRKAQGDSNALRS